MFSSAVLTADDFTGYAHCSWYLHLYRAGKRRHKQCPASVLYCYRLINAVGKSYDRYSIIAQRHGGNALRAGRLRGDARGGGRHRAVYVELVSAKRIVASCRIEPGSDNRNDLRNANGGRNIWCDGDGRGFGNVSDDRERELQHHNQRSCSACDSDDHIIDFCINNAIMGVEELDAYAQTEGER